MAMAWEARGGEKQVQNGVSVVSAFCVLNVAAFGAGCFSLSRIKGCAHPLRVYYYIKSRKTYCNVGEINGVAYNTKRTYV